MPLASSVLLYYIILDSRDEDLDRSEPNVGSHVDRLDHELQGGRPLARADVGGHVGVLVVGHVDDLLGAVIEDHVKFRDDVGVCRERIVKLQEASKA